jgi:hypothetical protein
MNSRIASSQASTAKQHLILYFDLNGTIMAGDIANGKSVEDSICQMLCEDDRLKSKWSDEVKEEVTFREYIETYLLPGDSKDQVLKKARQAWYRKFPEFLAEKKHDFSEAIGKRINLIKEKLSQQTLFPSFMKLIDDLHARQISHTIVLRTFGDDLPAVISSIESDKKLKLDFLGKFHENKLFPARFDEKNHHALSTMTGSQSFSESDEIYNMLKQFKFCAIQDDWQYWHKLGESSQYGKRFFYDPAENSDVTCIFFDDNIKKEIVKAEPLGATHHADQNSLQQVLMKTGLIVDVDTLLAVENEFYFIDKVNYALSVKNSLRTVDGQMQTLSIFKNPETSIKNASKLEDTDDKSNIKSVMPSK